MLARVDVDLVTFGDNLAGKRVDLDDALDLVAPELDADGELVVGGRDRQGVAADAELAANRVRVVALVLHLDEAAHDGATRQAGALLEVNDEALVLVRVAEAVDAGDGGDDDHVLPLEEGARGRVTQLINLLVDVGILGDIGVGAGDVGLRLVVVVVGDEVLDGVVGEELLELAAELRRQRPVGREDEGRALPALDDVGHGERLAGAGDAEQRLLVLPLFEGCDEGVDRLRLVAGGLEVGDDLKLRHDEPANLPPASKSPQLGRRQGAGSPR